MGFQNFVVSNKIHPLKINNNKKNLTLSFLLVPVFFRTALPSSGGYHLERGGMPLHDAVEINCKNGATTEYQGSDLKYMG